MDGSAELRRIDAPDAASGFVASGLSEAEALRAENERLHESLREHQLLLERLAAITTSISNRAALQEVLDLVVSGTAELLRDDAVAVCFIDPDDPSQMIVVASSGLAEGGEVVRRPVGEGAAGAAVMQGGVVVVDAGAVPGVPRLRGGLAAPVREDGVVVGALVSASSLPGREYRQTDVDVIHAFAEHASIALTDARTVEAKMRNALEDPLTGLPNRVLFVDRLEHALLRSGRERHRVALMIVDVDRFKLLNESLGHSACDELLVDVAARVRECVRVMDTAARLGGDEFGIVMEDAGGATGAAAVADRILAALRSPFALRGREVSITASIGIAIGAPDGGDAGELLRNADFAVSMAKARGRDSYLVFEPGMHREAVARVQLEADLQHAVDDAQLVLHYQPIVELASGAVTGFEALVRWNHPRRGLLPPSEFIGLAEECGAISLLGRWVLSEACAQAARWRGEGRDVSVGINLSSAQFTNETLVHDVAEALSRSGLPGDRLVLEITESVLMRDTNATIATLTTLRSLGVRIAIDDFGTGYSSLSYLQQFPVDILKVPKQFTDGIAAGPEASALARAIVKLSTTLGLETIAEGVESHDQLLALRAIRCRLGQGFLFGRPVPAGSIGGFDRMQSRAAT